MPSLRALGYKPFYNKLNVAAIGVGGRGNDILNDAARTDSELRGLAPAPALSTQTEPSSTFTVAPRTGTLALGCKRSLNQ